MSEFLDRLKTVLDAVKKEVQKVIDLWTFHRDTKSSDPNWLLVKTESEG